MVESSAEAAPVPWRLVSADSASQSCSKPRNPVVPGFLLYKKEKLLNSFLEVKNLLKVTCQAITRNTDLRAKIKTAPTETVTIKTKKYD